MTRNFLPALKVDSSKHMVESSRYKVFSKCLLNYLAETKKDPSKECLENRPIVKNHCPARFSLTCFAQLPMQYEVAGPHPLHALSFIHSCHKQKYPSLKCRWSSLVNTKKMILK